MSLFGDDGAEEMSNQSDTATSTSDDHASDAVKEDTRETGYKDQSEEESESLGEDGAPNTFRGQPWTWHRYTASERRIASSIDQIRAGNLSAHLYNAFILKSGVRQAEHLETVRTWQSKNRWIKESQESNWTLLPSWTAWPLEPQAVPRPDEQFSCRTDHRIDGWGIYSGRKLSPMPDLESLLTANALRMAKERWKIRVAREKRRELRSRRFRQNKDHSATSTIESDSSIGNNNTQASFGKSTHSDGRSTATESQHPEMLENDTSSSTSPKYYDPESEEPDEAGIPQNGSKRDSRSTTSFHSTLPSDASDTEQYTESGEFDLDYIKPVVMADDEKARRILQPTVSSMISKLDRLLFALHLSRQGYGRERISGGKTDDPSSKQQPGQKEQLDKTSKCPTENSGRPNVHPQGDSSTLKSTNKGRPNIYPKPLPGESYHRMRKRLDSSYRVRSRSRFGDHHSDGDMISPSPASGYRSRSRRKFDSKTDSVKDLPTEQCDVTSENDSASAETDNEIDPRLPERLNLRDWSEVIGLAAMTGWNEQIISRAAERCAALFGENMKFRTLHEEEALNMAGDAFQYPRHGTFPPLTVDQEAGEVSSSTPELRRPNWDRGALFCPHTDCWGHHKEFKIHYRVIEHIQRVHGYDPRKRPIEATEAMEGGVHIDGFLQPIYSKQGWRGRAVDRADKRSESVERRKEKRHKKIKGTEEGE